MNRGLHFNSKINVGMDFSKGYPYPRVDGNDYDRQQTGIMLIIIHNNDIIE